jgi:hypothetical protein
MHARFSALRRAKRRKQPFYLNPFPMKAFLLAALLMVGSAAQAQVKQVSDADLFKAFKQDAVVFEGVRNKFGGGGNCASIALIKAAIGTFGINGVFKSVSTDAAKKTVTVTRRDGKVLVLTFDRRDDGKAHFFVQPYATPQDALSQQISEYAAFCFAVMCRAKQLEMGYDADHFYLGVDKLNKGQAAADVYALLGLQKVVIADLSTDNLSKFKHVVLYNSPHAVYSSGGQYDEAFRGQDNTIPLSEPLSSLSRIHCRSRSTCPILGAYTLR